MQTSRLPASNVLRPTVSSSKLRWQALPSLYMSGSSTVQQIKVFSCFLWFWKKMAWWHAGISSPLQALQGNIPHKRCTVPIWDYMLRVPTVCCQNQKIPEQTSKQFTSISKPSKQFWAGQNISSVCFGSVTFESPIKRSKAHGQGTCPSQPESAGGAIGTFASRNQIYSDFDTEFVSCLASTLRIEQNALTHLRLSIIK